jgi:amidohydrolase
VTDDLQGLRAQLRRELPAAAELRHRLHRHPDRSGQEAHTLREVLAALPAAATSRPTAGTGALARLGGTGPAVAVRAELDALEVTERTGLPWASTRPGLMHACGHDVHLAALVALARAVHVHGGPAPLLAVLQPREESYPSGALDISRSGLLEQEQATSIVAAHVQPLLAGRTVACTPGAVNASSDEFGIRISGKGGHAGYPHRTRDPVVVLAHVVVALQSLVSRELDPMVPAVLSVTTLRAGSAVNVIPDSACARGTVRAFDVPTRQDLLRRLVEVVEHVAKAHGCEGSVELVHGEPVLENDKELAARTAQVLRELGLAVDGGFRTAGSDDFSYYGESLPSLMLFVGSEGAGGQLHSPTFSPADEQVEQVATALLAGYAAAAETYLAVLPVTTKAVAGAATSRGREPVSRGDGRPYA